MIRLRLGAGLLGGMALAALLAPAVAALLGHDADLPDLFNRFARTHSPAPRSSNPKHAPLPAAAHPNSPHPLPWPAHFWVGPRPP